MPRGCLVGLGKLKEIEMKTYAAALFGAVVIGAPAFAGGPVTAVVEPVIEPAPVVTVVTGEIGAVPMRVPTLAMPT
ncbi:hypothetical protein ACFSHQ_16080 [Gemmobacter lanyuensis]